MMWEAWLLFLIYFLILGSLAKPLGTYMARVYTGEYPRFLRWGKPIEKKIYSWAHICEKEEMSWQKYAVVMLLFNAVGIIFLYGLQRLQGWLPLNPEKMGAVRVDTAFSAAISFATNTNWQSYSGERTMSYLTQIVGLTVQNFLSAGTGMAVLVAFIRGFSRKQLQGIGNFWVDIVRSILYILLPLSLILAILLVSEGVPQTFDASIKASLLQPFQGSGATVEEQEIAIGAVASQIAIKQLGTNGGGYFNTNSAHPFENPTPISNFFELLAILLIPVSLCYTFGVLVNDRRQGWALLVVMGIIFIGFLGGSYFYESRINPVIERTIFSEWKGEKNVEIGDQEIGNMEGKEMRFNLAESVLWSTATTATSNGSVNGMLDSYMPLSGMMSLGLILLGEVIFGGVGSGLYGMLIFVIIAVFIAGLMIGRTPEYLGKKIESFEMKMALLILLIPVFLILGLMAIAVIVGLGKEEIGNPGPHGFTEILYAFASAANNNGSVFAGLKSDIPLYNFLLGTAMFFGRYWVAIAVLALAGSMVRKQKFNETAGTLATHTPLFIVWLMCVIIIIGVLNYLPVVALGPLIEHLMMQRGIFF